MAKVTFEAKLNTCHHCGDELLQGEKCVCRMVEQKRTVKLKRQRLIGEKKYNRKFKEAK